MGVLCLLISSIFLPALVSSSYLLFCGERSTYCRCTPGDACWPGGADWKALNSTLGGKLIKNVPIGSVCHKKQNFTSYDATKCAQLQTAWNVPETHINNPSSITALFFAKQSCDP